MPRPPRLFLSGIPQPATRRGDNHQANYRKLVEVHPQQDDLDRVRHSPDKGLPTGNKCFRREIERALSIRLGTRECGADQKGNIRRPRSVRGPKLIEPAWIKSGPIIIGMPYRAYWRLPTCWAMRLPRCRATPAACCGCSPPPGRAGGSDGYRLSRHAAHDDVAAQSHQLINRVSLD
jgi:hypothetical protein